jgi:uncharacterized protein (TIGR02271 family)
MKDRDAQLISVVDESGARGTFELPADDHENVWITFGDRRVLFPTGQLVPEPDGGYYLPLRVADYVEQIDAEVVIIPMVAETVEFHKYAREIGKVRIDKTVREEEEEVSLPIVRETVEVERVPIGRVVDGPVPSRREGNTLILPVLEEVLVVEKRLVLKEEVHITTTRTESEKTERVTLRKEDVVVERIGPGDERNHD